MLAPQLFDAGVGAVHIDLAALPFGGGGGGTK